MTVTPLAPGLYRVVDGSQRWTVAVAGPPENPWVWVNGHVARLEAGRRHTPSRAQSAHVDLSSPMPATVVRLVVEPGQRVARGDTLVILEAMKMELPIRAPRDAVVKAVHCRAGELVQAGVNLIELE